MDTSKGFWGQLILDLRNEARMSQRHVAEQVQVNRRTLRKLEKGIVVGNIELIEKLLNFFGYELEAIRKDSIEERRRREELLSLEPGYRSKQAVSRILGNHVIY